MKSCGGGGGGVGGDVQRTMGRGKKTFEMESGRGMVDLRTLGVGVGVGVGVGGG